MPRPFFALAPMSGVTDAAYRSIIARYGRPDLMCTEFVPADGLDSAGRDNLRYNLWKSEAERPVVAQIYGGTPESYIGAARFIAELGFDGVDINMGCPARVVEKRRAGAALIRHQRLARQIVAAAQEGAGELPVSVKTRIGYSENEIEHWLACLIAAQPAAVTIHARTRDEESRVPARWDVIAEAVRIAREIEPNAERRPLIVGNGDVASLEEARRRAAETGCDGVMIGRGIFGNPWFFNPAVEREELPLEQVLEVMLEHAELYASMYDGIKPLDQMKKHFKAYVSGFDGAAEVRARLMEAQDLRQIREIARSAMLEFAGA